MIKYTHLKLSVFAAVIAVCAPTYAFAEQIGLPGYYVPKGSLVWNIKPSSIRGKFDVLVWRNGTKYTILADSFPGYEIPPPYFPGYEIPPAYIEVSLDQAARSVYVRLPLRRVGSTALKKISIGIVRISDRGTFSYYVLPYKKEIVPKATTALRDVR